jgi:hypothetical protein
MGNKDKSLFEYIKIIYWRIYIVSNIRLVNNTPFMNKVIRLYTVDEYMFYTYIFKKT